MSFRVMFIVGYGGMVKSKVLVPILGQVVYNILVKLLSQLFNLSQGNWRRNLKCGNGVMLWPNGAKYEGLWNRNRINGKGTYLWPGIFSNITKLTLPIDGDRYEGEWVNNCRRGKGILYLNKGKTKVEQDWDEQSFVFKLFHF